MDNIYFEDGSRPWIRQRVHKDIAAFLQTNGKVRNINKGHIINNDKEGYPYVSYILSGAITPIWKLNVNQIEENFIFLLLSGRIFGRLTLVNIGRGVPFEAIAESCIYEVPIEMYMQKCFSDHAFLQHHLMHMASVRFSDTKYLAARIEKTLMRIGYCFLSKSPMNCMPGFSNSAN